MAVTAERFGSFGHDEAAPTSIRLCAAVPLNIEATTVIFNGQAGAIVFNIQRDFHLSRPSMFDDIAQRLLDNSEQRDFGRWTQPYVAIVTSHSYYQACSTAYLIAIPVQGCQQALVVENGRS